MSSHRAHNIVASVHQRLLNLAAKQQQPFQVLLTRYALERLLYRLGQSAEASRFILKGALLFWLWDEHLHRATRDLDLLGSGDNSVEHWEQLFRSICSLPVEADGLVWLPESVVVRQMREDEEYEGLRAQIEARLGNARIPVQVDIGFGDAVTPAALEAEFPTLLDFPAPRLRAYPRETVVAEKFWIMAQLGMANSRLKDFYDLWVLGHRFAFEGAVLAQAIQATFARRRTPLPSETPLALTGLFGDDRSKQVQWQAFLSKGKLEVEASGLGAVVGFLQGFLLPPTLALPSEQPFALVWPAGGPWQEKAPELQVPASGQQEAGQ
ncbi:MAG TPA: nucleotidyl transferase AbiEii/AbiGii toxin family protein [Ktedonobacterales bacterium]|jgi:hypothetical protein